ncbi:MAG: ROK family protein [Candidatus Omnitrophica bacterium]|nr:ROK family protein [Candidatus Omnitrophota bacterium]
MLQKYFIGIDIGGTKIYGGLVTPAGEIIASHKVPTPSKAKPKEILTTTDKVIQTLLKNSLTSPKNLLGIGIAVPGIVDNNGKIVITPNIDLSNTDLKKILEKKYKTKISVGNDVNLGVLGEKWLGAGRKAKNIVGLFPGTGVGGGVIVNGNFITGSHGAAAELGHIMVDEKGPVCTCGNIGCLEAFAGRWAIERDLRAAIKKGGRSILTDLAGKDLKQIKSSTLAKALKAKDPLVTKVMTRAAIALAKACVSLNHIFDPEIFLFGGGVVEACGDLILPVIEKALKKDPFFARLSTPKVVQAKLGDDAVMLGAVAAVRQITELKSLTDTYYPLIKLTPSGKIIIKGKNVRASFFIRADGKIKESKDFIPLKLSDEELEEICKKGPDIFFVVKPRGKQVSITPKGLRFLRKKRILPRILPLSEAIKTYNNCADRKAALFYL